MGMELTLNSRKLDLSVTFFKIWGGKYGGKHYIYANLNGKTGTNGKQLFDKKNYALEASDDDFEKVCKNWFKKYVAEKAEEKANEF